MVPSARFLLYRERAEIKKIYIWKTCQLSELTLLISGCLRTLRKFIGFSRLNVLLSYFGAETQFSKFHSSTLSTFSTSLSHSPA